MGAYRILAEDFVEAAAAGKKLERLVEDQEWLGQRIDDRQCERLGLRQIKMPLH